MSQQGQQLFSSENVAESAPPIGEIDRVSSANEGIADLPEATQPSWFAAESSNAAAESAVEVQNSDNGLTEEPSTPASGSFGRKDHQHEEAVPPSSTTASTPDTTETALAKTQDLEAVVAKVLARMNPEMFQSMTEQLLKPVIEAIVRSELDKK
jgi:hypothetical protein